MRIWKLFTSRRVRARVVRELERNGIKTNTKNRKLVTGFKPLDTYRNRLFYVQRRETYTATTTTTTNPVTGLIWTSRSNGFLLFRFSVALVHASDTIIPSPSILIVRNEENERKETFSTHACVEDEHRAIIYEVAVVARECRNFCTTRIVVVRSVVICRSIVIPARYRTYAHARTIITFTVYIVRCVLNTIAEIPSVCASRGSERFADNNAVVVETSLSFTRFWFEKYIFRLLTKKKNDYITIAPWTLSRPVSPRSHDVAPVCANERARVSMTTPRAQINISVAIYRITHGPGVFNVVVATSPPDKLVRFTILLAPSISTNLLFVALFVSFLQCVHTRILYTHTIIYYVIMFSFNRRRYMARPCVRV